MNNREFVNGVYIGVSKSPKGDIPICVESTKGGFCLLYDLASASSARNYIESIILTLINAMPINRTLTSLLTVSQNLNLLSHLQEINICKASNSLNDIKANFQKLQKIAFDRVSLLNKKVPTINDYNKTATAIKPYYIVYLNINDALDSGITHDEVKEFLNISYSVGIYTIMSATMDSIHQGAVSKTMQLLPMFAIEKGKFIASDELIDCIKLFDNFKADFEDSEILLKEIYKKTYEQMPTLTTRNIQKENLQIHRKKSLKKEQNGIYNMDYRNYLKSFKKYKQYQVAIFRHFKFEDSLNNLLKWLDRYNIKVTKDNILNIKELNLNSKQIHELPEYLKLLKNLEQIDLSNNALESFPNVILELTNLKELNLANNNLSDIPKKIKILNKLESLNIAYNNFNTLPSSLAHLKQLKELNIAGNNIDTLTANISFIETLESLNISNNNISKITPIFAKLKHNIKLNIANNPIYNYDENSQNLPQTVIEAINVTIKRNEDLIWQKVKNLDTKEAYKSYLKKFKNARYRNEIESQMLETIEFENNLESLQNWIKSNNLEDFIPLEKEALLTLKELDLSSKNLENIPKSFSLIKNLKSLDLRNNNLKSLPESIGKINKLTHFYIGANKLEYLPKSLKELKSLKHLNIWSNKLSILPEVLCELENLQELNCSHNEIAKIPETFNKLQFLRYCDFSNNKIEELNIPLQNLKNLKKIYLSDNKLKDFPKTLNELKSLKFLELDNNQISKIPTGLKTLNNLITLNINENKIDNIDGLSEFAPKLRYLSLSHNLLKSVPKNIDNLKLLQELNLNFNNISKLPESFSNLINLEVLNISNNSLKYLPKNFGTLVKLSKLYIAHNKLKSLPKSFTELKNLKELDIRGNPLKTLPDTLFTLDNSIIRELKDLVYENEKTLWKRCKLTDTKDSYKIYLQNYPNGIYSLEAKKALEEKKILITKVFKKLF